MWIDEANVCNTPQRRTSRQQLPAAPPSTFAARQPKQHSPCPACDKGHGRRSTNNESLHGMRNNDEDEHTMFLSVLSALSSPRQVGAPAWIRAAAGVARREPPTRPKSDCARPRSPRSPLCRLVEEHTRFRRRPVTTALDTVTVQRLAEGVEATQPAVAAAVATFG